MTTPLQLVHSIKEVNGVPRISSRAIGESRGTEHRNVLQVIDELIATEPGLGLLNFQQTPYVEAQNGQTYREYLCDEKGALLVGMNLGTRKTAVAFQCRLIDAFQACRDKLRAFGVPPPPPAADLLARVSALETDIRLLRARPETPVRAYVPMDIAATLKRLSTVALIRNDHKWIECLQDAFREYQRLTPRQASTLRSIARRNNALVLEVIA